MCYSRTNKPQHTQEKSQDRKNRIPGHKGHHDRTPKQGPEKNS